MKNKNAPRKMGSFTFLALWAMGYAFTWISAWFGGMGLSDILNRLLIWNVSPLMWLVLAAGGVGSFLSIIQILLVERGLKQKMRGWLPVSMAGWALSALWLNFLITTPEISSSLGGLSTSQSLTVFFASFLVPPALTQFFWLRRRVKSAWLWVIAAWVSAAVFVLPFMWVSDMVINQFLLPIVVLGVAGLLHALIAGATMRHLWTQPLEKDKRENATSAAYLEEDNFSHLQLGDESDNREEDDFAIEKEMLRRK